MRDAVKEDYEDFWKDADQNMSYCQEAARDYKERHRGAVLSEAAKTINGSRQDQYGNPEDSFAIIAKYWSVYTGMGLNSGDVALMMALMKIAREQNGAGKHDNIVDACGYLALYEDGRPDSAS